MLGLLDSISRTAGIEYDRLFSEYFYQAWTTKSKFAEYERIQKELLPCLKDNDYALGEIRNIEHVIYELYSNAVVHGNLAGEPHEYNLRALDVPTGLEKNQELPIKTEAVINGLAWIITMTDTGDGGRFALPVNNDLKVKTGRGLRLVQKYADIITEKHNPGFTVAAYKIRGQAPC